MKPNTGGLLEFAEGERFRQTKVMGLNQYPVSISADAVGPMTLCAIPDPTSLDERAGHQLLINAAGVTNVDAFTALTVRCAAEQHLAADPEASVCIWTPTDIVAASRMATLLGELPDRATFQEGFNAPNSDQRILVPAVEISNESAITRTVTHLSDHANGTHRGRLRIARHESKFLAHSAAVFLVNALEHCNDPLIRPWTACSMEPNSRTAEVCVLDLGTEISHSRNEMDAIKEALLRSKRNLSGLDSVLTLADRRGIAAEFRIKSGTALVTGSRGKWTFKKAPFSPGWAVSCLIAPTTRREA